MRRRVGVTHATLRRAVPGCSALRRRSTWTASRSRHALPGARAAGDSRASPCCGRNASTILATLSVARPPTSARLRATLVSRSGNTSSRPSPRSRMTAAVQGPIPLMPCNVAAASALDCSSSIATSSVPAASASPTRLRVASLPALKPTPSSVDFFARSTRSTPGNAYSVTPLRSTGCPHATIRRPAIALAAAGSLAGMRWC